MGNTGRLASDQLIGGIVNEVNLERQDVLAGMLSKIKLNRSLNLSAQDNNFFAAVNEIQKARDFLGDPSKILGSSFTKHGEIAENMEVNIGNAKELLRGLAKRYSDNVGRTAPEDFIMDGIKAQSKFYNSEDNTLSAVLEHMEKYKNINFGRDGSKYVIPKDYFEHIKAMRNGENPAGLSPKKIASILDKVKQIEKESGRPFEEVAAASRFEYSEVQKGAASQTIDREEASIKRENEGIKKDIDDKSKKDRDAAVKKSAPSLEEANKIAAVSAALEGTTATLFLMYNKHKNLIDYSVEDWKEVGVTFGAGAIKGGIRGYAIYGLTNYAKTPAPLASSYVSTAFGVAQIYNSYKNGGISADEAFEQGEILCFDAALSLTGSAIGQTLIPIPYLGAVIGSIASNVFGSIIKNELNKNEERLIQQSRARYQRKAEQLDRDLAAYLEKLLKELTVIWNLSQMAFDYKLNSSLRFDASQKLARAHGVSEDKILKTIDDVDDYFLN